MRYLLDTNILIAILRGNPLYKRIEIELNLSDSATLLFISTVSKGELLALAVRNKWGEQRQNRLRVLLNQLIVLDIATADEALFDTYAELDCHSQNNLPDHPLPLGKSARKMGKNDLWIAATARLINATLITTDGDFENLVDVYLPVKIFVP